MSSEYDPVRPRRPLSGEGSDLDKVQALVRSAGSGYLRSPWPWVSWAIVLPGTAFLTRPLASAVGPGSTAVLLLWSLAILAGGAVEALAMRGAGSRERSEITGWVFKGQGNLSVIAVILTGVLVWKGLYQFLPGVWLLLVGHSFFVVGGLVSRALERSGLLYQVGGLISVLPWFDSLTVFAWTTALANLAMAVALFRERRRERQREKTG